MKNLKENPEYIFVIDGIGALLSAFLLGVVLVRFEAVFGIPASALYFLASFPMLFALFDLISYLGRSNKSWKNLRAIAILNILYCLVSLLVGIYHHERLTVLGWAYLLIEILIVLFLAKIEFQFSKPTIEKN